jgi:hypothetical protein
MKFKFIFIGLHELSTTFAAEWHCYVQQNITFPAKIPQTWHPTKDHTDSFPTPSCNLHTSMRYVYSLFFFFTLKRLIGFRIWKPVLKNPASHQLIGNLLTSLVYSIDVNVVITYKIIFYRIKNSIFRTYNYPRQNRYDLTGGVFRNCRPVAIRASTVGP